MHDVAILALKGLAGGGQIAIGRAPEAASADSRRLNLSQPDRHELDFFLPMRPAAAF